MRIDDSADDVTGVTYGGVEMSEVAIAVDTSGEEGNCKVYFLGSSVPTGAKTVQVTSGIGTHLAAAVTVTSVGDTDVIDPTLLQGDGTLAEQLIDDGSPGSPSLRYAGGFSGLNAPPAVGSNSTSLVSIDDESIDVVVCVETTAGQGSRPVGFSSATTDDRAFVHLAVVEIIP